MDHCHLDLGSSHTAYRRVTLINLYLHTKFLSNCKNFVDGRTQVYMHVRMDGQTDTETSFSRLTPSWPKSVSALAQIVTAQFFHWSAPFYFTAWFSCFTSPPTQYRLYGRRFLQVKRPNQQYQSTEGIQPKNKENTNYTCAYTHKIAYKYSIHE